MDRREFLGVLGTTAAVRFAPLDKPASPLHDDIYLDVLKSADGTVDKSLQRQQANGGFLDELGIPTVGGSAYLLSLLTGLYLAPESSHYHSAELLNRMDRLVDYLLRVQHPNGTIDLHITNFPARPAPRS